MSEWRSIDPMYASLLERWDMGLISPAATMINCTNCAGVGKILYHDPTTGMIKEISCQGCGGSGQRDNGDGQ